MYSSSHLNTVKVCDIEYYYTESSLSDLYCPVLLSQLDGFQRHFDSQIIIYGKQVILNLIDQKGSEKQLEQAFDKMVSSLGNRMVK